MNVLLDTNVLIDYVGKRPPHYDEAEKVMAAGYFGDAKLWVSAQSLKDAYYVLSGYADQLRVQKALRRSLDVITLAPLTARDAERGLYLEWDDYEDCLIGLCAESVKADYIITRDKKGFARSSIPPLSPSDWLSLMKEDYHLEYDALEL